MTPCIRVEEYAVGLDQPGTEEHLRECARCREALERVRKIEEALRSVVADEEPVSAAEVRTGLELAQSRLSRKRRWKEVLPMAAAAAILLGIVAWISGVFAPKPIPPRPEAIPAAQVEQDPKEQDKLKAKLAALDEAIRQTPRKAALYLERATVHLQLRSPEQAVNDCFRAIEIDPTNPEAYTRRGDARRAQAQIEPLVRQGKDAMRVEAIRDYSRAIELDPLRTEPYLGRGLAHSELLDFAAAIADFTKAIELNPREPDSFRGRGDARVKTDRVGALEDYRKAVELAPSDWPRRKEVEKAILDLSGGVKLTYRLQFPEKFEGDRRKVREETIETMRRRINQRGLKEPLVTALEDDKIVLQIAVQKTDELEDYRAILNRAGKLELRVVADSKIQDAWKANPKETAPRGWAAFKMNGADEWLLCAEQPVLTGADVRYVSYTPLYRAHNAQCTINFQLTDEGTKKLDAVAAKLYDPERGLRRQIAIILDGQILSAPTVNSEAFHGSCEMWGNFDQKSAENLVITLRSGSFPVPLKLESEEFEGPK